jgi:hypothetical protein
MHPELVSVRAMPQMPVIKSQNDDLKLIRLLMRSSRKAQALMATGGGSKVHQPRRMTRRTPDFR